MSNTNESAKDWKGATSLFKKKKVDALQTLFFLRGRSTDAKESLDTLMFCTDSLIPRKYVEGHTTKSGNMRSVQSKRRYLAALHAAKHSSWHLASKIALGTMLLGGEAKSQP